MPPFFVARDGAYRSICHGRQGCFALCVDACPASLTPAYLPGADGSGRFSAQVRKCRVPVNGALDN